jgi:DNA-binding NtrC family response regulator
VRAMKQGAADFLTKPVDTDHLLLLVDRAGERRRMATEYLLLKEDYQRRFGLPRVMGEDPAWKETLLAVQRAASSEATVLLQGESGTGKELLSRALHQLSPRAKGPFVAINCAAFPREILENELFGHEKGAFTGAINEKQGCFELADGGTLFLDEVAEMEPDIQVKFLRALEQRSFRRLGGKKEISVDIRVVSATNKHISKAIEEGKLREDLYHRLAVIPLFLPPLRERRGDVRLLSESFLRRFAEENGKKHLKSFAPEALEFINSYRWPGNVRELKNAVERAAIFARGDAISFQDLRAHEIILSEDREIRVPVGTSLQQAERTLVLKTFSFADGDHHKAASLLGIDEDEFRTRLGVLVAGEAAVPA